MTPNILESGIWPWDNTLSSSMLINSKWLTLERIRNPHNPPLHSGLFWLNLIGTNTTSCLHQDSEIVQHSVLLQSRLYLVTISPNSCLWGHLLIQFRIVSIY